jgi:hypothetical protein
MAKVYRESDKPKMVTSDRVAAGWKSHRWATSGEVHPVQVRTMSKNARRKMVRYA